MTETPITHLQTLEELRQRLDHGMTSREYVEALEWALPQLRRLVDATPAKRLDIPYKVAGAKLEGTVHE